MASSCGSRRYSEVRRSTSLSCSNRNIIRNTGGSFRKCPRITALFYDRRFSLRTASEDLVGRSATPDGKLKLGEPDEDGLYVTVSATVDGERFGAALLFSCATDNAIYRTLAADRDAILYRGAPYRQDQYAYGIKVHVGPITGWQPPLPPSRRQSLAG